MHSIHKHYIKFVVCHVFVCNSFFTIPFYSCFQYCPGPYSDETPAMVLIIIVYLLGLDFNSNPHFKYGLSRQNSKVKTMFHNSFLNECSPAVVFLSICVIILFHKTL